MKNIFLDSFAVFAILFPYSVTFAQDNCDEHYVLFSTDNNGQVKIIKDISKTQCEYLRLKLVEGGKDKNVRCIR